MLVNGIVARDATQLGLTSGWIQPINRSVGTRREYGAVSLKPSKKGYLT